MATDAIIVTELDIIKMIENNGEREGALVCARAFLFNFIYGQNLNRNFMPAAKSIFLICPFRIIWIKGRMTTMSFIFKP
ncbi:hypothetical protein RRU94_17800 [Domibacillus sp. DTU_2020_1001157_1_SI_ALB_TIR_016]|uniref:hypothetical protein n=1 Tax=Domibacillus sp. DTU_2020_1001157_1_SI_ALB_TIR_016 TaxID=3077789 RepID=UPI0028E8B5DF|nr:hypothetical protein [Domibacillus sp. DTU_2020_1001157_1_SI_ALB_TIR_016]WNS79392.1 hypothetical protein RRU94_17800 [Domibacillus sp. DTU_2020_1001157_1_SI_ALB_TIR_016]